MEPYFFQVYGTIDSNFLESTSSIVEIRGDRLHIDSTNELEFSKLISVKRLDWNSICFATRTAFLCFKGREDNIESFLQGLRSNSFFRRLMIVTLSCCKTCGSLDFITVNNNDDEKCKFCHSKWNLIVDENELIPKLKSSIINTSKDLQVLKFALDDKGREYRETRGSTGKFSVETLQQEYRFWLQRIQQYQSSVAMVNQMIKHLDKPKEREQPKPEKQVAEPKPVAPIIEQLSHEPAPREKVQQPKHETQELHEEKKKRKNAKWKLSLLLLFATLAFAGVVVGVVFITSAPQEGNGGGGNPLDRLITAGILTAVGGLGILGIIEYLLKKRGKTYGPFFDLAVGLAFFLIQGGIFALIARGVSEWSVLGECIAVIVLAVLCRFYLKNHIGGIPNVDKRFRLGGIFSWTAAVFSTLTVSWVAFPVWPLFDDVNKNWMMAGELIVLFVAFCLSLESDRGFLIVSTTAVLSCTPVIWTAATMEYLYGIMFLIVFGVAGVVAAVVPNVRLVWLKISTTILLIVGFFAQIVFYFLDTNTQDWAVSLPDLVWIISLLYLPGAALGRAPFALSYWMVGIVVTSFPAFCAFYPILLVVAIFSVYTDGTWSPAESDKKEENESETPKAPKNPEDSIIQKEVYYRWILRISSIGMWVALLLHTYVDDRAKYFIPIVFAVSLLVDFRLSTANMKLFGIFQLHSNQGKVLYDKKYPTDWKKSVVWTVCLFLVATSLSKILTDRINGLYVLFCLQAALVFAIGFLFFDNSTQQPSEQTSKELATPETEDNVSLTDLFIPSNGTSWVYPLSVFCFAVRFLVTETQYDEVHWPYYIGVGIAYFATFKLYLNSRNIQIFGVLFYLCIPLIINPFYDEGGLLVPLLVSVGMTLVHLALSCKNLSRMDYNLTVLFWLAFIGVPTRIRTEGWPNAALDMTVFAIQISFLFPGAFSFFRKTNLPESNQKEPEDKYNVAKDLSVQLLEIVILCATMFWHFIFGVTLAVGAAVSCVLVTFQCQRYHRINQLIFLCLIPISVILNLAVHRTQFFLLFIGIELYSIGTFFMLPFVRIYVDAPEEGNEVGLPQHQDNNAAPTLSEIVKKYLNCLRLPICKAVSTLSILTGLALIYASWALDYVDPALFTVLLAVSFVTSITPWMENIYYVFCFPVGIFMVAISYQYGSYALLFPAVTCAVMVILTSAPLDIIPWIGRKCLLSKSPEHRNLIREFMWQFCFLWIAIGSSLLFSILHLVAIGLGLIRAFTLNQKIFYFISAIYVLRMISTNHQLFHSDMNGAEFFGLLVFGWAIFSSLQPLRKQEDGDIMSVAVLISVSVAAVLGMFLTANLVHGIVALVLLSSVTVLMLFLAPLANVLLWIYPLLIIYPVNILLTHYATDFPYGRWGCLIGSIVSVVLATLSTYLWNIPKKTRNIEISPPIQENFKNLMWILAVILSFPAEYAAAAVICALGFIGTIRKKWLGIATIFPGLMALALSVILLQEDVSFDLAPAIAAGVACAVTSTILYLIPRKMWVASKSDNKIPDTIDFMLCSTSDDESNISLVIEEQLVLWWLISGMIVSYSQYERTEIWRGMIFPALALIFGTVQAVAGFLKSQHKWRAKIRTQGMLLMSIAVISGAAVSFSSEESMAGGILLVVAGCIIIAVVILQLYWWNVFQKWMNPKTTHPTVKEATVDPFKENPKPQNQEEEVLA